MAFNINSSVSEQGRVVVNADLDLLEINTRKKAFDRPDTGTSLRRLYENNNYTTDDVFSILPGELCFMNVRTVSHKRKLIRDKDVLIYSSFNGALIENDRSFREKEAEVVCLGVAGIETIYNSSTATVSQDQAVVQVGGCHSIRNTGPYLIQTGDLIYWSLPEPKDTIGQKKIVGATLPFRLPEIFTKESIEQDLLDPEGHEDLKNVFEAFAHQLETLSRSPLSAQRKYFAGFTSLLFQQVFRREQMNLKSKIIGRALNTAKPGQEFDILLGSYSI